MVMPYLEKVNEREMTEYRDPKSLYKVWGKWKKTSMAPQGKGCPGIGIATIVANALQMLKD
jgi:hypothetical protein